VSTNTHRVCDEATPLDFGRTALPERPTHGTVLLVRPTYFDVRYRINPYMGGRVDGDRATEEWDRLRRAYERYADRVVVLDPDEVDAGTADRDPAGHGSDGSDGPKTDVAGDAPAPVESLPDLVFCANLAVPTADGSGVVLAEMATEERAGEPAHFAAWCREAGFDVAVLDGDAAFEGTGDAIWHPGRRLLWGGYGVRTERAAYDELARRLDTPVVTLELSDDRFYHLDVCLAPLTEETALVVPEAFTEAGLARIEGLFERTVEVPAAEATGGLACNSHGVDGEHVLLGSGNPETERRLEAAGFTPVPVPTTEFRKAGGSVRCLKLALG
jgi:N-dimethylarginine dimethylaminohydrolase